MLSLKGNTAVYLQYAHARIAGIVRKAGVDLGGPPALPLRHLPGSPCLLRRPWTLEGLRPAKMTPYLMRSDGE
jgi:hypothetical protein